MEQLDSKNEIKEMHTWFNFHLINNRIKLNQACKSYNCNIDAYMCYIYKNIAYSRKKLAVEMKKLRYTNELWYCSIIYPSYNVLEDTFTEFKLSMLKYINLVNAVSLNIHEIFTRNCYVLKSPLTVYKGILCQGNNNIYMNLSGITSLDIDIKNSLESIFSSCESLIDDRCFQHIILEFVIPVGTNIFPISICSQTKENRILLLNQGNLKFLSRSTEVFINTGKDVYINKHGRVIDPIDSDYEEDEPTDYSREYTHIKTEYVSTGDLPIYPKNSSFKVV